MFHSSYTRGCPEREGPFPPSANIRRRQRIIETKRIQIIERFTEDVIVDSSDGAVCLLKINPAGRKNEKEVSRSSYGRLTNCQTTCKGATEM